MLEKGDGTSYDVTIGDHGPECTCNAYRYGVPGASCKHISSVKDSGLIRGLSSPITNPLSTVALPAMTCDEFRAARALGMAP